MYAIKNQLSKYLSIYISILLISILLATDISVDTWISKEFDRALKNKASLLITLVSEDISEIDFDFADELMPEFSGKKDPEYFHLWRNNQTFERSKTLDLFKIHQLPKLDVELNHSQIVNITLPDGRSGRMIYSKFLPQIDSDVQEESGISKHDFAQSQQPMELAYAISNEELNQILWFVDIIFVLSSILAVLVVRVVVAKVVAKGLRPLDQLNNEIKAINLNSDIDALSTEKLPEELMPIANGINHFLKENRLLYAREQRVTSDIAHELKTPITELLNLSEVAIKFPEETQITDNFTTEVLAIAERLKSIVNGILLLQKSASQVELTQHQINIEALLRAIILRENKTDRMVRLVVNNDISHILANEFALETIVTNLLGNALYYSPSDSEVVIDVANEAEHQLKLTITNVSIYHYTELELEHFFEPLWQKDTSRTSSDRYGLGLAIVKSYCDNIKADLTVRLTTENNIVFTVVL